MNTQTSKIITLTKAVRAKQIEYNAEAFSSFPLSELEALQDELDKELAAYNPQPELNQERGFTPLFQRITKSYSDHLHAVRQLNLDNQLDVVYVSGKVTGLNYADVKFKFENRKVELEALGYVVINPCDLIDQDTDWPTAMAICIALLPYATRINLLDDWQESAGATLEKELADKLGIKTLFIQPCSH